MKWQRKEVAHGKWEDVTVSCWSWLEHLSHSVMSDADGPGVMWADQRGCQPESSSACPALWVTMKSLQWLRAGAGGQTAHSEAALSCDAAARWWRDRSQVSVNVIECVSSFYYVVLSSFAPPFSLFIPLHRMFSFTSVDALKLCSSLSALCLCALCVLCFQMFPKCWTRRSCQAHWVAWGMKSSCRALPGGLQWRLEWSGQLWLVKAAPHLTLCFWWSQSWSRCFSEDQGAHLLISSDMFQPLLSHNCPDDTHVKGSLENLPRFHCVFVCPFLCS